MIPNFLLRILEIKNLAEVSLSSSLAKCKNLAECIRTTSRSFNSRHTKTVTTIASATITYSLFKHFFCNIYNKKNHLFFVRADFNLCQISEFQKLKLFLCKAHNSLCNHWRYRQYYHDFRHAVHYLLGKKRSNLNRQRRTKIPSEGTFHR